MRKRVTFVEHLKRENLLRNGSGHVLMRSAEVNKRFKDGFECLPSQQERAMHRGTHINVSAGGQNMKTIHVPKSMMSAPFLQVRTPLAGGGLVIIRAEIRVGGAEGMKRKMWRQRRRHKCRGKAAAATTARLNLISYFQRYSEDDRYDIKQLSCINTYNVANVDLPPVAAFGKAIHALSRIGDELWLDPMVKGHYSLGSGSEQGSETTTCKLVMKVYQSCWLFTLYRAQNDTQDVRDSNRDSIKLELKSKSFKTVMTSLTKTQSFVLKSVLPLFRCLGSIERNVERCHISISIPNDRVMIQFFCRHDHMKTTYTEMSLHPDEFDYFQFGGDSDITFCLKELRVTELFLEAPFIPSHENIMPVCFSVEDMVLQATVVLATLIDCESRGPSQPTETSGQTSPRCAAVPVGSCEADTNKAQDIPAGMEVIASSQGSPIFNPAALMQRLPQTDDPHTLGVLDEACASANTTPASSLICSLLFRALSSEQDDDGCATRLPVLACYSDIEEDMDQ
ncbi:hypothetical protein PAMA_018694 [Pampus argenteus]